MELLALGLLSVAAWVALRKPPTIAVADVEAMARMFASEVGGGGSAQVRLEKVALGQASLNYAKRRNKGLYEISFPWGAQGGNRPWSTAQAATVNDRELATSVLLGDHLDRAHGGYRFYEPAEQDRLFASRDPRYRFDAAGVRRKWAGEGLSLRAVVGRWELWG